MKPFFRGLYLKGVSKLPIDGVLLKEKDLNFAHELGETAFKAYDCWLSNWKSRYAAFLFELSFYISMETC